MLSLISQMYDFFIKQIFYGRRLAKIFPSSQWKISIQYNCDYPDF